MCLLHVLVCLQSLCFYFGASKSLCFISFIWFSCFTLHQCVCGCFLLMCVSRLSDQSLRGLNGVCCPNALLIKLDWTRGLVGTCHKKPRPHPSPADLAAAWPPGHGTAEALGGRGGSSAQELTTDHHYPPDLEPRLTPQRPPSPF